MTLLEAWIQTPPASAAGWTLLHSLWEGALIACVLAAALLVIRSPRSRYAAALLAMLAMVASFGGTFIHLVPQQRIPPVPNAYAAYHAGASDQDLLASAEPLRRRLANIPPWAAPFWMAGVLIFYVRHLANWTAARRLRRIGVCCPPDFWQQRMADLAARVRVSCPVALLESCLTSVPVVIGHMRPVVLMPVGLLAGLPVGQIEAILLHELAHIRRYDYLVNMLQISVEGLLFYHPAVWWISGIMRAERENCCDDLVVAIRGDAHEYALALAALEHSRWGAAETALAATGGSLVNRIRRLLDRPQNSTVGLATALTPIIFAAVLMLTTALAMIAWQEKAPAQDKAKQGPARRDVSPYLKWLGEEAVYIISDQERAAFERLQTDPERERFIEQFWLRRDPTPGTPENEYREEHYRRIAYANDHFGTRGGKVGWATDRGRIYIKFGPPDELEAHGAANGAPPNERWRYRFIDGIGADVNMEFVDRNDSGDFPMTRDPGAQQLDRVR
jgi:GWxTD domain-containing protein